MSRYYTIILFVIALIITSPLKANDSLPEDFTELSLEALMSIEVEVTTVSRRAEKLADAAAAVFVITQEDIQRSGATNIPDLLRMAPGLQVAKIDANKWAITSRGFNGRFANKLLVLMDGRSVYSPLFSGVFWDAQSTVLEDIERIEIIRGPGATLWGANAVNGVINIITKSTQKTLGVYATSGVGSEEKLFGTIRYGGSLSDNSHYKIYTKYFNRDSNVDARGSDTYDQWYQWQSGFRVDHGYFQEDQFTFQGDIYQGKSGETAIYPLPEEEFPYFKEETENNDNDLFGGNLLGRWSRIISETSDLALQTYYDHSVYNPTIIDSTVNTIDFDFQHRFEPITGQSIMWGAGYRYTSDDLDGTYSTSFKPNDQNYDLISAFIQDDITLIPETWRLTIGTKFENNDFSGDEWQPSARLLWTPDSHQSIWTAVSRAVRTPSRGETSNRVRTTLPNDFSKDSTTFIYRTLGNTDFISEQVITYELGYRIQPTADISLDLASFYNNYDKLRGLEILEDDNQSLQPSELPLIVRNNIKGDSYGIEVAVDYRILNWWRLQLGYNYLRLSLHSESEDSKFFTNYEEGAVPKHQASLRSFIDISETWQLDLWGRYVDNLPSIDIESYLELDARLSWKIRSYLELSLVGQNLLANQHSEFVAEYLVKTKVTEVQRGAYAKIDLKF